MGQVSHEHTFFVPGKAKIYVPARDEHHVIPQVLSLDLCFLHHENIGLENIKHRLLSFSHPVVAMGVGSLT